MKIAVCPGSFDPVTYGHLDIVCRTAEIFDLVYLAVLTNPNKTSLFSVEERLDMLGEVTKDMDNVKCESFSGLVVDYAREKGAIVMVRGLRAVTDFEFEFKLASMNSHLDDDIETMFMMTSNEYSFISSSAIKEVASLGGNVSKWVPPIVARKLAEKYGGDNCEQD